MHFFVHARLGVVLSMYILTLWLSICTCKAWRASMYILTLWLSICTCKAWHARLGVLLSMYILTLRFLPSFAHYFIKPSAALDSIRINFNSVEENLALNALFCPCTAWRYFFRMQFCCPCAAGHGSVHAHPNFRILNIESYFFSNTVKIDSYAIQSCWKCLKIMSERW